MTPALHRSYAEGLDREWQRLAAAGTWWTGPERVAIASTARAARDGASIPPGPLPEPAVEAAVRLAVDPHVDQAWIDGLVENGLRLEPYVELLAIVTRLSAVDTFLFGVGAEPRPLPEPEPGGEPTRELVPEAEIQGALVPTVGVPFPPTALTAVPPEAEALMDLHGVLYLSMFEMGDHEIVKDLSRVQLELVAARTSLLNQCFY